MYSKIKGAWQKHLDFIILDIIAMQISYILAYILRHGLNVSYFLELYLGLDLVLILAQLCIGFALNNYRDILRRGYFEEFKYTAVMVSMMELVVLAYLFLEQSAQSFSRIMFVEMYIIGIILIYVVRICWKRVIQSRMSNEEYLQNMILISTSKRVEKTARIMQEKRYSGFFISGILLEDYVTGMDDVEGIPVLGSAKKAGEFLRREVVDEVFIDLPVEEESTKQIQDECSEAGITTHLNIGVLEEEGRTLVAEPLAGHIVLTSSLHVTDARQLMLKRIMDIVGGIVGLTITGILTIIFAPIIFIQSPGPIFFSQLRVGRNGRKFRIYKFRSMYPDAEQRKKDLMEQNKMKGLMFKMENDPRIIPIGHFMRKTSLDEFPQFWNVLKGDMSLVGTRPPTVDEYEQYEMHHKVRLATKPGLTGLWQVSGRSDIVDFEEVVRLDKKYIAEWNIGMDFKILLQTVKLVFTGKGSM